MTVRSLWSHTWRATSSRTRRSIDGDVTERPHRGRASSPAIGDDVADRDRHRRSPTSPGTCCCRPRSSRTPTSTRRSSPSRCINPTGDLMGAIEAMQANRHVMDTRRHHRARRARRTADGRQRLLGDPHPRRPHGRPRAAQRRGAGRGAPARRRRDRHRDRRARGLAVLRRRRGRDASPAPRRARHGRRPRRRVPPPRGVRRWRHRDARPTSSSRSPPTTACPSTCTPTRRSTRAANGLDRARPAGARRVRPRRHREPLRQPRHAARGRSSARPPSGSPRPAST